MNDPWLDDEQPLEAAQSEKQIHALLAHLDPPPRRVLDVGCGAGRVLRPLAAAGHHVTGLDANPDALARCRAHRPGGGADVALVEADFTKPWPVPDASFDAALCLGNTFMLLSDVDDAVALLRRAAAALRDGGEVILDNLPADFWPELTGGGWQAGLSEDGSMQLVWAPDDAVFTLRRGEAVDPDDWTIHVGEPRYRLWTMGAMRLASGAAGLSAPAADPGSSLLVMRRANPPGHHGCSGLGVK